MTAAGPFWITWWLSQCCLKRVSYKQIYLFFSWLFGREINYLSYSLIPLSPKVWLFILPSGCYTFICKLVVDPVTSQVYSQQNRECDVFFWSFFWFGASNASPTLFVCGNLTFWKSSPHLTLWAASSVIVGSRWGFGSFLSIICFNLMSLISVKIFIFRFSFDVVWMWSTWNTVRERKTQISKVSSDVITTVPSSCHHCKTLFELML